MSLTNSGIALIAQAVVGSGVVFNNANAHIGVGSSGTAFDASQTDLQGASKIRKGMDVGYPIVNGNKVSFKSTFNPDEANFSWNEWGVFNHATSGTMLNRVAASNGTKQNSQTWVLEVDITFALGE